jgi:deazaflavin-dependent oxidoreductase (nitroreductase family)
MPDDWNQKIIEEFRANGGKVGGQFEGAPMILVHHKGRKTGTERVNPLVYQPLEGRWAIFASKAGAPSDPEWYLNLVANPRTTIEVGTSTYEVVARTAAGSEREKIWEDQKKAAPGFADYEVKAGDRVIPVVVLEPVS